MHLAIHGRDARARDCAEKAFALFPPSPHNIGLLAGVLRSAGEKGRADELLAQLPPGSYEAHVARLCFHLVRDEIDAAAECAEKAADARNPNVFGLVVRVFERVLRKSPGWPALLKKINLTN
jgi:hypothetical protein